jgi:SP family general alpha glucoside:H+ symporter-like MFS transporter
MSVAGEVSAVRLRAKTSALGFFFNYTFSTIWNVVVPYMFNPDQGNLAGKMGWIFFATCVVAGVIVWLEIPETKDLSFAEIDRRFEMRVSAREFNTWRDLVRSNKDMELGQVEQMEHVNS